MLVPAKGLILFEQPAQYGVKHSALLVVVHLNLVVYPQRGVECQTRAVFFDSLHLNVLARRNPLRDANDLKGLLSRKAQAFQALPLLELQGHDAHAHQVVPVDALIALRHHCLHTQ